jgi:hypothetical protein
MFAGCFSHSSRSTLLLRVRRGRVRRRLKSVIALKAGIAQLRLNRCSIPLTLFIEDILSAALLKSVALATCSVEASRERSIVPLTCVDVFRYGIYGSCILKKSANHAQGKPEALQWLPDGIPLWNVPCSNARAKSRFPGVSGTA